LFSEGDAANSEIRKNAKNLFLSEKPVPAFESVTDLSSGFVLGTLSHVIHDTAPGYRPLDDFPEEAPDPTTRNPPVVAETTSQSDSTGSKIGSFTGLAPGDDADYLFGEDEGLGDDADDGWGAGWDDDEEQDDDKKSKKAGKAAQDDWGMGDDDWGMGGDDSKQEAELSWDLEDDSAEAAKKEEDKPEEKHEEEKAADDDDGWGMVDEEPPKDEENEEKPKQKMLGDADIEESDANTTTPAAAPAETEAPAAAPEEPAPTEEEKPANEEEAPKAEETSTTTVAAVEEGEADE